MCIALISTAHPAYQLIIVDNRDEFLHRPTASAGWWQDPHNHVLGSRDLARPEQGTWMGVTKQGRVAVLTNYREVSPCRIISRGAIVNAFLTEPPIGITKSVSTAAKFSASTADLVSSSTSIPPPQPPPPPPPTKNEQKKQQRTTRQFVADMIDSHTAKNAGGFSLVCGKVGEPLAIISNRMPDNIDAVTWIAKDRGETVGLSNTVLHDRTWPKIINGEVLLKNAIDSHVVAHPDIATAANSRVVSKEEENDLIDRLFDVLNTDTFPRHLDQKPFNEEHMNLLKESIFIPLLGNRAKFEAEADQLAKMGLAGYMSGLYGTQKQTVLLVDFHGRVRYVERSLYDGHVNPIPIGEGDRSFEFTVENI